MGASIIPQVNAILYSLLLFDERVEGLYNQGISNVFGYIFAQVDLNAATEINWNLPGE